jgi:hypothetical protein
LDEPGVSYTGPRNEPPISEETREVMADLMSRQPSHPGRHLNEGVWRPDVTRNRITIWTLVGFVGCGGTLHVAAAGTPSPPASPPAALELPEPTGRFAIGTVVHVWEDPSREEVASDTPAPPRTLGVQLWYPAEAGPASSGTSAYVDEHVDVVAREMLGETLGSLRTHAREGAEVAGVDERFPVVLFSPGFGISRSLYTLLYEELASHGYVVAAIDHPFMNLVALPGRGLIDPEGGYWNTFPVAGPAASYEEAKRRLAFAHEYFAADQLFVLAKLAELNRSEPGLLTGRLDLGRVGSLGHSAGALAPHGLMLRESPVDAVVLYDVEVDRLRAGPGIVVPVAGSVHVPSLAVRLEYAPPPEASFEDHLRYPLFDVSFDGATHLSISDVPLLQGLLQRDDTGAVAALAQLRALTACTRSFLDTYVRGAGDLPTAWSYEPPPGVAMRTLWPSVTRHSAPSP